MKRALFALPGPWMKTLRTAAAAWIAAVALSARAQEVEFTDPAGDDRGPGNYTYPTDTVYTPGSFDLTSLKVTQKGDKVTFDATLNSELADPWRMGTGFAVQMIFVHIDTGAGGFTEGIPGTNVSFAQDSAWDKVIVLSPQNPSRVQQQVKQKVDPRMTAAVVTADTRGKGRTISATVDRKALGAGDLTTWGYQVVVQSNDGFPDKAGVLTRKVDELEGQHRFGGGDDGDCDPHAMDVLGDAEQQKMMLSYECGSDGSPKKKATLTMVRK